MQIFHSYSQKKRVKKFCYIFKENPLQMRNTKYENRDLNKKNTYCFKKNPLNMKNTKTFNLYIKFFLFIFSEKSVFKKKIDIVLKKIH